MSEIINEIMTSIHPYCSDAFAVENALYIVLQHYEFTKKSTEIVKYEAEGNEMLIKKFLICKKIKGCTDQTIRYYGSEIPKALDVIGKNVVDITTDDLRLWLAQRMRTGIKKTTLSNEKRCMSSFFTFLHGEGIILKNPMIAIDNVKQPRTKKEAFWDDEIVAMRDMLKNTRQKAIFEILLSTGCRVSELVGIKLDDIGDDGAILVHGKGQKDRWVYLNASARYALEKYLNDRNDDSLWLFPRMISIKNINHRGIPQKEMGEWYKHKEYVNEDEPCDKGTIEFIIRRLGKEVGVNAYPHKFRRTCATNALKNGMDIMMVSKMLGHESVGTTQIYLDINDDDLKINHQKYVR